MARLSFGETVISMRSGLGLVALAVMLAVASPFGIYGVVTGWVLLILAALFDLFG